MPSLRSSEFYQVILKWEVKAQCVCVEVSDCRERWQWKMDAGEWVGTKMLLLKGWLLIFSSTQISR